MLITDTEDVATCQLLAELFVSLDMTALIEDLDSASFHEMGGDERERIDYLLALSGHEIPKPPAHR